MEIIIFNSASAGHRNMERFVHDQAYPVMLGRTQQKETVRYAARICMAEQINVLHVFFNFLLSFKSGPTVLCVEYRNRQFTNRLCI
jgi:hypothetical protein